MKKVTIIDIANELDISPSTVSRALNGIGRMNDSTRQQIHELAQRWGYHPNPHALRLKKSKTFTIGLIIPELTHHFYSRIIKGIDSVLNQHGYQQMICVSNEEYDKEVKAVDTLLAARVDGLLIAISQETNEFRHIQRVLEEEVPVVFLDRMCEEVEATYVMTDDFKGAFDATNYLVKCDCTRIIFLKGPENISTSFTRFMGYKEGLKQNYIAFDDSLVVEHGSNHELEQQLIKIFESGEINGLLAHSDYHAFRAMEILKQHNIQIPSQVQLVGYADEPLAQYTSPKITTIRQPAEEIGQTGMSILLKEIETGEKSKPVILNTELIVRDSTRGI